MYQQATGGILGVQQQVEAVGEGTAVDTAVGAGAAYISTTQWIQHELRVRVRKDMGGNVRKFDQLLLLMHLVRNIGATQWIRHWAVDAAVDAGTAVDTAVDAGIAVDTAVQAVDAAVDTAVSMYP